MVDNNYKIDKELYYYFKKIFAYPRPINSIIENKRILKDRSYNPQLKYERGQHNLFQIKSKLKQLKIERGNFGDILNKKRNEMICGCNLFNSIGTSKYTDYSVELHGQPNKELIKKSYKLMDLEASEIDNSGKNNTVSSVKKFLDSLLQHGFKWHVQAKEMVVGARFNLSKKVLYINKTRRFSDLDIKRLIIHEIGTHIARAENGKKQKYFMFSYGFPNYLETEEGLAVYNEEENKLLPNNILKNYGGRVIAVDLALKNSFSIVYNELLEYFDKYNAWNLTLRAKRGLIDTSKKGAFTKDYIYLKGRYLVKDFIRKGGNVKDLYVGKIGVEHIPLVKQII